ncbi:hypothetical protein C2G38_152830 [Gigaspora rosea]|uniref:GmrSD restriction endonucleases C-terminal domain-containing protein n=1 Tax=Gigaspora rosea TaxID=44941 RepID=A0A397VYE3_9GLOM|nr:hypothetical protein C2G38_152830 [Gigaspora rosea]
MALGVEYFRQYEENNTPEQHKTFFRELEVVMVYFLLARPFCLNKEITEFIKKWVQNLRQSQITVDPSSGDNMDLDQITFKPSAEIDEGQFREAIDKCDVYNYPDIRKFVLAKNNEKLADPHINALCPEIDMTIEHICPQSAAQPGGMSPWRTGLTGWHHTVIKKYLNRVGNLALLSRPPTVLSGKRNTVKSMTHIRLPVLRLRNIFA